MAEYEKVTPAVFRRRLKDGHYAGLTGALRAVGRMSAWTDAQKDRARREAEKHFADAPKAKKKASKKAKKKVAKKASKKVAKKRAASKSSKRTVKNSPIRKRIADNKRRATRRKKAQQAKAAPAAQVSTVQTAANKIGTISQALTSMKVAKELGAGETEVAQGAKKAQLALTAIVEELSGTVAQTPLTEEEQVAAENLAKAAAASAGSNGQGFTQPQPAESQTQSAEVAATAEL